MLWFLTAAGLCGADLFIKYRVEKKRLKLSVKILAGKVTLTQFKNPGAMLGFLKNNVRFLLAFTMICLGFIAGLLTAVCGRRGNILLKAGLTLLLGGAGSNAYDRLIKGTVTDYIRFNAGPKKFQNIIFNLGDFFIFAGFLFSLAGALFFDKK